MKLHIYSSRNFQNWYSDDQEIPDKYCVDENCVITVKREKFCPKECELDRPFGQNSFEKSCCKDC